MSVLIDSDIVIEVLRGRNRQIIAQWIALANSSSPCLVSPITIAEIGAGALPSEMLAITQLFTPLTCVVIGESIGQLAGDFLRRYAKSHSLKIADALIAASAVQSHASLWTRNRKHYPMSELTFFA